MVISLKNRNFLKLLDYTPAEIQHLIDLAIELKAAKKAGCEKQTPVSYTHLERYCSRPGADV